jgi:hypothetical protein
MAHGSELKSAERTPEAVRAELERARAELVYSVSALRDEMLQRTDWRGWVRRRPLAWMGAAFAVGFLLAERR